MDLLLHEVVVATLHDVVHLHLQGLKNARHSQGTVGVTHIEDAIGALAQVDHIVVLQNYNPTNAARVKQTQPG